MQATQSNNPNLFQQMVTWVGLLLLGIPPVLSRVSVPVSVNLMPVSAQARTLRMTTERTRIHDCH